MKVALLLDDDLGEAYQKEAASRRVSISTCIAERLLAAKGLDPRRRTLLIDDEAIVRHLEQTLGGGSLTGQYDLATKVSRLANISFGDHRFEITPGQFAELKFRAGKTGRSVEQLVADMYTKMSGDFFRAVP
jgi:hypothetical protein